MFLKSDVEEPILGVLRLASQANRTGLDGILNFIAGNRDDYINLRREDRVPRFWANSTGNNAVIADGIMLGVGVCFGAIHCIAWDFSFPTHAELLIWRISSVAITAVPFYIPFMFGLVVVLMDNGFKIAVNIIGGIAFILLFLAFILYILAWIFTLALAFTSLRDLPHEVFDTIHWTTFLPHV